MLYFDIIIEVIILLINNYFILIIMIKSYLFYLYEVKKVKYLLAEVLLQMFVIQCDIIIDLIGK